MQNSDNSSPATQTQDNRFATPRSRFALTGRSVLIDPRTDAARRDLADIRLADRVFAPHYAAPVPYCIVTATPLRATRDSDGEVLAMLSPPDMFEVLELSAGFAWGRAPGAALVGYVDAAALEVAA